MVTEADCGARALELVNSCVCVVCSLRSLGVMIASFQANEPDKQFQVILIDVYMPDMGGLELLCQLRSLSHCRSVPVISTLECDSRESLLTIPLLLPPRLLALPFVSLSPFRRQWYRPRRIYKLRIHVCQRGLMTTSSNLFAARSVCKE